MSWRYWSNAVEGDERKKPLDLLSVERSLLVRSCVRSGGASGSVVAKDCRDAHVNAGFLITQQWNSDSAIAISSGTRVSPLMDKKLCASALGQLCVSTARVSVSRTGMD